MGQFKCCVDRVEVVNARKEYKSRCWTDILGC